MKKSNLIIVALSLLTIVAVPCSLSASSAGGHAPIGVMGDHTHEKGEFMMSYRFMRMDMKDNRIFDRDQRLDDLVPNYMVAPLTMTMDMHMVGAMFAPNDSTTLMLMVPYVSQSMNHEFIKGPNDGTQFSRNTEGIGDISLTALTNLKKTKSELWILNTGISVPVGAIDEDGGTGSRLPYAMQVGSGTYDFILGSTYSKYFNDMSVGLQFLSKLRTGLNKNGYRLGNTYQLSSWTAKSWADWISTSARITGKVWDNLDGYDSAVMPNGPGSTVMVPTAEQTQGGKSISLGVGANIIGKGGLLDGHRLAFEFELPVYEYFLGTHLKTQWTLTVGWQKEI
jgi:hypothetical protein